jgi:DNA-binding NarL/FixJ family response regulator
VQRSILQGLAAGLTDEALAARLDLSVRTCRRHIAGPFDLLGAESRFQAGVLAARRGWLPVRPR